MRLLVALDDDNGLDSKLSLHFGYCPFFALYDVEEKNLKIIKNDLNHSSPDLTPVDQVMKFKPDVVFSLGMGQRAIGLFAEKNIKLKKGNFKILKEVIDNFDSLDDLEDSCGH